jgi:hypothetical protein
MARQERMLSARGARALTKPGRHSDVTRGGHGFICSPGMGGNAKWVWAAIRKPRWPRPAKAATVGAGAAIRQRQPQWQDLRVMRCGVPCGQVIPMEQREASEPMAHDARNHGAPDKVDNAPSRPDRGGARLCQGARLAIGRESGGVARSFGLDPAQARQTLPQPPRRDAVPESAGIHRQASRAPKRVGCSLSAGVRDIDGGALRRVAFMAAAAPTPGGGGANDPSAAWSWLSDRSENWLRWRCARRL